MLRGPANGNVCLDVEHDIDDVQDINDQCGEFHEKSDTCIPGS